jgi:hypothetical protein
MSGFHGSLHQCVCAHSSEQAVSHGQFSVEHPVAAPCRDGRGVVWRPKVRPTRHSIWKTDGSSQDQPVTARPTAGMQCSGFVLHGKEERGKPKREACGHALDLLDPSARSAASQGSLSQIVHCGDGASINWTTEVTVSLLQSLPHHHAASESSSPPQSVVASLKLRTNNS